MKMKKDDKQKIILHDVLGGADGEGKEEGATPTSEASPINSHRDLPDDQLDEDDLKGVRLLIGVGAIIALLSAVALGIGYALGDRQVKMTGMVTSDCALCADMGTDILKAGGSAVDAAITTMFCNGLVNMHASGIGGGGYIMVRDHKNNRSMAIDFNSAAPMKSTQEMYKNINQTLFGSEAVAVPGEVSGLAMAHQYYGKLPWADLIAPVSKLARKGFPITKDVNYWMNTREGLKPWLKNNSPKLYRLLVDKNDKIKAEGTIITRPDYADALDLIAADPLNFYQSEIADDILKSCDGTITQEDLTSYRAFASDVLRIHYHDHVLETHTSPAGGPILFHILKVLEGFNLNKTDLNNPGLTYHRIVEAMKFGFASFPENVDFPDDESRKNFTDSLLHDGHCEEIRKRITDDKTHPPSYYDPEYHPKQTHGTSACGAIDENEVYISIISSINYLFGSGVMTEKFGIIMNNNMEAYDLEYNTDNRPNPGNFVKGGRRPRSSMSPTVFYNNNTKCETRGFVGGIGAMKIIPATLQYLLDVLSFGYNAEESIARPRVVHNLVPNVLYVEDKFPTSTIEALEKKDHKVEVLSKNRYLAALAGGYKKGKTLYGQGDHRKQGRASIIQH